MTLPKNPHAYENVREVLDQALASEKGLKLRAAQPEDTPDQARRRAITLRQRIYRMRKLDREISERAFEPGDERRGRSVYDALIIDMAGDEISIRKGQPFKVEEID